MTGVTLSNANLPDFPSSKQANEKRKEPALMKMEGSFNSKLTSFTEISGGKDRKDHTSAVGLQPNLKAIFEAKGFFLKGISGKGDQKDMKEIQNQEAAETELKQMLPENAIDAMVGTTIVLNGGTGNEEERESIEVEHPLKTTAAIQAADSQNFIAKKNEMAGSLALNKKERRETKEESISGHDLLSPLTEQITKIISGNKPDEISIKDTARLLNMLEKWNSLQKQSQNKLQFSNLEENKSGSNVKPILLSLIDTYQKRVAMEGSGQYKSHSSVSVKDVANWVKQAMERYAGEEISTENGNVPGTSKEEVKYQGQPVQPMTKAEQFVIHLQQGGQAAGEEQKLRQELEQVVKAIRVNQVNGNTELLLKVKPASLGEVVIKLVEVNGEMVVKINVASQAAKEMLESNIHQLKHMFSPSQVVIEKTESSSAFQDSYQPSSQQESLEDHDTEKEPAGYEPHEKVEEENEAGRIDFSEMLMQKEEVENNDYH